MAGRCLKGICCVFLKVFRNEVLMAVAWMMLTEQIYLLLCSACGGSGRMQLATLTIIWPRQQLEC
jgi:hypothetical protein